MPLNYAIGDSGAQGVDKGVTGTPLLSRPGTSVMTASMGREFEIGSQWSQIESHAILWHSSPVIVIGPINSKVLKLSITTVGAAACETHYLSFLCLAVTGN